MLVSEILSTVRPASGSTWDEVLTYFRTEPHERRRVEELMEEIRASGLQEPGRIDFREYDPDYPEDTEEYFYLGNGTHRFAAHLELGLEDFPVVREELPEIQGSFYQLTEVELWIKRQYITADKFGDDPFFECFASSLNFRLAEDCWVELGGCSSTSVGPGQSFNLSLLPVPEKHLPMLAEKVLERISCCVTPEMIDYMSVGTVTHYDEDFWNPKEGARG